MLLPVGRQRQIVRIHPPLEGDQRSLVCRPSPNHGVLEGFSLARDDIDKIG